MLSNIFHIRFRFEDNKMEYIEFVELITLTITYSNRKTSTLKM